MHKFVIEALDPGPVWALPAWVEEEIRDALPAEWELIVFRAPGGGRGDARPPEPGYRLGPKY